MLCAATAAVAIGLCSPAGAITVSSLAALRAHSADNNATIVMAPGEYWINHNGSNPNFVDLTGSNSTFDMSQATFKVDTRTLDGLGSQHVNIFMLQGSNLTLTGLDLEGMDLGLDTDPNAQRWADATTNYVRISGSDNSLLDSHLVVRGSTPYGYGDAFGKGANPGGGLPFISHHKGLGVWVRDSYNATIDGLDLEMKAFGHGVYMQRAQGLNSITNTTVTGQLFSSNDVIDHPLYQQHGVNTYGQVMFPDIMISGSEDGIRSYGDIDGLGTADIYLENVVVRNMREAFSTFAAEGNVEIVNCEAYENETGFEPGDGTIITGGKASATNGPVLYYRRDNIDNTVVDIELLGDQPQPGRDWDIAYISGGNNDVTLTDGGVTPGILSQNSLVRLSQRFNDWRHDLRDIDDSFASSDLSIMNTTGQDLMIGTAATSGTNDYYVNSGNKLGGSGTIFTAQTGSDASINFNVGGLLDPVGELDFSLGEGDVYLGRALSVANSQMLLFELGATGDSDRVEMLDSSDLNIGNGVLEFDDFVFTTTSGFAAGTFTLFASDHAIVGSLGSNLTGTIDGLAAELSLGLGSQSILLTVAPSVLAGDYNDDGVVDAADYTVWRDALGGGTLANETASPGVVDEADFLAWKVNFGASGGGGAATAATVPEPATLWLSVVAAGLLAGKRKRRPVACAA